MKFSEILQKYRKDNDLTVPAFANKVGVPQRTMESWLGEKRVPDNFKQEAIKQMLGIKESTD